MPNLDFNLVQNYMIIFCVLANVHATTKNSFEPWKQYDIGNEEENNSNNGKIQNNKITENKIKQKIATNKRKIENIENEQTANSLEWNILQVIAKKIN